MKHREIVLTLSLTVVAMTVVPMLNGAGHGRVFAGGDVAPADVTSSALNTSAYNAKMMALANLPRQTDCETRSRRPANKAAAGVHNAKREPKPESPAERKEREYQCLLAKLWPTRAVPPQAGALLPFKRIVAYYGNFYSPRMGVLGQYPPDKVISMLDSTAAEWKAADPSTPVVPAVDYIVVAAQDVPGRDGKYRMRMPPAQIEKAVSMANRIQGLLFLDVQPGWSSVEAEVPRLASYLKQPNVELALDPEFALQDGKRPGAWRGTMTAADINWAARFLANIVNENHLPPKILVVHRFTQRMVEDYRGIRPLPEVEVVMDMDGFGSPALKDAAYRDFIATQPVQFTGFKLFYKNDVKWGGRLMTPRQVLRLSPQPSYILYQ